MSSPVDIAAWSEVARLATATILVVHRLCTGERLTRELACGSLDRSCCADRAPLLAVSLMELPEEIRKRKWSPAPVARAGVLAPRSPAGGQGSARTERPLSPNKQDSQ